MKTLLLALLVLAGLVPALGDDTAPAAPPSDTASTPSAEVDPAKDAEIRKMIQKSGVEKTMGLVMNRMFDSFKAQNPSLPPEFWMRIESEMDMKDLVTQLIPIFAQYYSIDDLKAINAFYDSPAGRHMIEVQPQITTQAMQVGQQWGQKLGGKIVAEIQAEQAKSSTPPASATPAPASGH
jgi:uncharacterized protein